MTSRSLCRKRELECHRGPYGWEVIFLDSFILLLQIHTPLPILLCARRLAQMPNQQTPFVLRLLVVFCQWEVLAGIGGRKRTRSECPSAEGHHSYRVVLPKHLSSADWAATSSFYQVVRFRGSNGSPPMLTLHDQRGGESRPVSPCQNGERSGCY